ncbi:ATP-binding protein [Rhodococcus spelaei]|uniref:ATP-binding protein n=1 Tax=Rhodococcus spelaei TaxID=2546320 RepID=A0A541BNW3_9NOCA|nr:ATP-binding protein [Rhodococcus spelaei]TQF74027.1 ATP-binding protein [Rhodococcus spelaei]
MSKSAAFMGLGDTPDLERIIADHAYRGVRLQLAVRTVLVVLIALTLVVVPPARDAAVCYAIFACYALWAAAVAVWMGHSGRAHVDASWLALFVDLAVVAALTLVAGIAAQQSWTANILTNALFMIPLLACTQLRPGVCAAVVVPTVAVFLTASWATMTSNEEPWSSILLSTMALAGLGGGAIGLSWIQRSRVHTIGTLVRDRTALLAELMNLEQRERQALSERLHDGALQYVLAARQDLDDVRNGQSDALDRMDEALHESSRLLRSATSELHPAVLEHVGLAPALADLARSAAVRGGFDCEVNAEGWPDGLRTSVDSMLYGVARELLTNVVKHAAAQSVRVDLRWTGQRATLEVVDDGVGIGAQVRDRSLTAGHIGLASQELRLAAAGGSLSVRPGTRTGAVARVDVPGIPATRQRCARSAATSLERGQ